MKIRQALLGKHPTFLYTFTMSLLALVSEVIQHNQNLQTSFSSWCAMLLPTRTTIQAVAQQHNVIERELVRAAAATTEGDLYSVTIQCFKRF